jgi:hypothetical protein
MHTLLYDPDNTNTTHYTYTVKRVWNTINYNVNCNINIHTHYLQAVTNCSPQHLLIIPVPSCDTCKWATVLMISLVVSTNDLQQRISHQFVT